MLHCRKTLVKEFPFVKVFFFRYFGGKSEIRHCQFAVATDLFSSQVASSHVGISQTVTTSIKKKNVDVGRALFDALFVILDLFFQIIVLVFFQRSCFAF